jgi:multiple sugar transport system substrate-binding protein
MGVTAGTAGTQGTVTTRRALLRRGTGAAGAAGAAGLTGLLAVACAGQSAPPTAVARDARADLIWYIWSSNTNVRGEAYNAIVAHFQEQYPNVTVQQVTGGGNLKPILEKLITLVTAGEPLDVVGVRHDVLGQYAQMGLLKDLGPLTRREPGFRLGDHLPSAVEMLSFKGKQYALPIGMSTSAMAYNADILAREGVRPPDGSWDWRQFQELAQRLTARRDEGTQWGMHIPPTSSEIFPWIWMNGGEPFSPKEEPSRATFSQAEVQEAVGWFTDLSTRYAVKAPWETPDGKATNGRFGEGRVVFFPVQSNNTRELQDRPFQWDIAPFPKGKRGQAVYPLSSFSYGVYGQTKHEELALKLWTLIVGQVGQREWMTRTGEFIPSHKSLQAEYEKVPLKPASRRVFFQAAAGGRPTPKATKWNDMAPIVDEHLQAADAGKMGVKAALESLDRALVPYLAG